MSNVKITRETDQIRIQWGGEPILNAWVIRTEPELAAFLTRHRDRMTADDQKRAAELLAALVYDRLLLNISEKAIV